MKKTETRNMEPNDEYPLISKQVYDRQQFLIKALKCQSANLSSELKSIYSSLSYNFVHKLLFCIFPYDSFRRKTVKHFLGIAKSGVSFAVSVFLSIKKSLFFSEKADIEKTSLNMDKHSRSFLKKSGRLTVLVVDRYVPRYDKDAGSRSTHCYLTLLSELGYDVKFMGADFCQGGAYGNELENSGIEVLYGEYYKHHWKEWFFKFYNEINFIFLNRPIVAGLFIDFMKSVSKAKIIYNVHDLHFLRISRESDILGMKALHKKAIEFKKHELDIIRKADTVITFSCYEKEIIDMEFEKSKAEWAPILYFQDSKEPADIKFKQDILFVGSFSHFPNEDGILWFIDKVWQELCVRLPDCKLFIVGSDTTERIKILSSDRIIVTGYVSDDALTEYYKYCKVAIIPLRYGAGVKGKVVEAMYNRIGIVSTSVGLEGLKDINDYIIPSDTPECFLSDILSLYVDDKALRKNVDKSGEYIEKYFSRTRAVSIIKNIFK